MFIASNPSHVDALNSDKKLQLFVVKFCGQHSKVWPALSHELRDQILLFKYDVDYNVSPF